MLSAASLLVERSSGPRDQGEQGPRVVAEHCHLAKAGKAVLVQLDSSGVAYGHLAVSQFDEDKGWLFRVQRLVQDERMHHKRGSLRCGGDNATLHIRESGYLPDPIQLWGDQTRWADPRPKRLLGDEELELVGLVIERLLPVKPLGDCARIVLAPDCGRGVGTPFGHIPPSGGGRG